MRIVALADTHLFHDELSVPLGDVLIHAGDLCRFGDLAEVRRAGEWLSSLPHAHKIVVAGNHDQAFVDRGEQARQSLGPGVIYLEDAATTIDGLRLWGSPWQPEFNAWAFNLPRGQALADKWALFPEGLDVLITHGPPRGFGDRSSTPGRLGCDDLLARVRQVKPRVHLFGHIHEDGGAWLDAGTWFVNCTTWECDRPPTIIDIDGTKVSVWAPARK